MSADQNSLARWLWRLTAGFVTAAVLVSGALMTTDALAWHGMTLDRRVAAPGVTVVTVEAELLSVVIEHGPVDEVQLRAELNSGINTPEISTRFDGSVLRVATRCSTSTFGPGFCNGRLALVVPPDVSMEVTTDLGSVTGNGLQVPSMDVQSDLGRVRLGWNRAPDRVALRSGTGSIWVDLPEVGGGYATRTATDTGSVSVSVVVSERSQRRISVATDTGDIALR